MNFLKNFLKKTSQAPPSEKRRIFVSHKAILSGKPLVAKKWDGKKWVEDPTFEIIIK